MRFVLFFSILLLFTISARASDYNRSVSLDWDEIPGADAYEVEWYEGVDCKIKLGSEKAGSSPWKHQLPAGNYCMRVRGINGDQPGDWTDYQRTTVKPIAPRGLDASEKVFKWEKVPYAQSYDVDIVNTSGRYVYHAQVTNNEFTMPDVLLKDKKLYAQDKLILKVRTNVNGTPSSNPREKEFSMHSIAPRPEEPKPVIAHETPAPKVAHVELPEPKEKKKLERKPSAAEIEHEYELRHPYELKMAAGLGVGSYNYNSSGFGGSSSNQGSSINGTGQEFDLDLHYGTWEKRLGYHLKTRQMMVNLSGAGASFSEVFGGVDFRLLNNERRSTVLSAGFGFGFLERPLYLGNGGPNNSPTVMGISLFGFQGDLAFHQELSRRWAWDTDFSVDMVPGQQFLGNAIGFSGSEGRLTTAAVFTVSSAVDLKTGVSFVGSKYKGVDNSSDISFSNKALFLQGVYRVSPTESRSPAAESLMNAQFAKLWEAQFFVPIEFKQVTLMLLGPTIPPGQGGAESGSTTNEGLDVSLRHRFSAESPWSLGINGNNVNYVVQGNLLTERGAAINAGYDLYLRSRRDFKVYTKFGIGYRQLVLQTGSYSRFNNYELQGTVGFEKSWSDHWLTQLETNLGWVLMTNGNLSLGQNFGSDFVTQGATYQWNYGANMGYRIFSGVSLWAGYRYQRTRFPGALTNPLLSNAYVTAESSENQIRLGLGFNW